MNVEGLPIVFLIFISLLTNEIVYILRCILATFEWCIYSCFVHFFFFWFSCFFKKFPWRILDRSATSRPDPLKPLQWESPILLHLLATWIKSIRGPQSYRGVFFSLSTINTWDQIILFCWGFPVHYTMFRTIPGLYILGSSNTQLRQPEVFLNITKFTIGDKYCQFSQLRSTAMEDGGAKKWKKSIYLNHNFTNEEAMIFSGLFVI